MNRGTIVFVCALCSILSISLPIIITELIRPAANWAIRQSGISVPRRAWMTMSILQNLTVTRSGWTILTPMTNCLWKGRI